MPQKHKYIHASYRILNHFPAAVLQNNFPRISRVAFIGTIRTLEAGPFTELIKRLLCYNVTAWHHHRGISISALFLADGADEDGVEVVLAR